MTALFSKRLPHILTRTDLATLLTATYAAALDVDAEEAHERLTQVLASAVLQGELLDCVSSALRDWQGPRTTDDALIDKLSKAIQTRRGRVRAAPSSPAVSAVLVRVDLEAGIAPEMMRATLETEKGRALLASGLKTLGTHLLKELLK
ncbi:MAG: hypothetical protein NVSMB23_27810 [Myxococcales bacterium]